MEVNRSRVYRDGMVTAEGLSGHDLAGELRSGSTVVWVDLKSPTSEQLHQVADELGLHELAVEDALKLHQRPKLDRYPDHLFLSCHSARVLSDEPTLEVSELAVFIGSTWLITVHHGPVDIDAIEDRWDRSPDLASEGVGFLVYGLLDVVVDGYFTALEVFDTYYDDISEAIFSERPIDPAQQLHWFQMRRALFQLHRLAVPLRETVSSLMRRETWISEHLYPYYQDVYDHILRITESTDSLRDLVSTIVETNLSLRDYRQNQVMKKVTSWAAIIAVPTLITGFYGMNVPFPGFASHGGVWVSAVLMAVLPIVLFIQFRRSDWL